MILKRTSRVLAPLAVCAALLALNAATARAEETENTNTETVSTETNTSGSGETNTPTPRSKPRPLVQPIKKIMQVEKREEVKNKIENKPDMGARMMMQGSTTREEQKRNDRGAFEETQRKGRENAIGKIKENIMRFVRFLEVAIAREEKLISRIQSRTDKLAAEGKDVSAVTVSVTTATNEINAAKLDLASIKTVIPVSITVSASTTPATVFGPVRDLIKSAQTHIKAAHHAVRDAVQALKQLKTPRTETNSESNDTND